MAKKPADDPVAADGTLRRLRRELECLQAQAEANAREIEELRAIARNHEVLDVDGCAELLRLSPRTVQRRVQERWIPFVKLGGNRNIRFIRADILSWLRRGAPASRKSRLGPFKGGQLHKARGKPEG